METLLIPSAESEASVPLHRSCVRVGNISLHVAGHSVETVRLDNALKPFMAEECDTEIDLSFEWADCLHPFPAAPAFDSGAVWKSFRSGEEWIFDFISPPLAFNPYKRLVCDQSFRCVRLYLNRELLEKLPWVSPLEYPADELLFTNYLAFHGLGVEVHGCGLIDADDRGHLFLGHSGAGKSTTARVWETFHKPKILSDDRIILRLHEGELWMYGTPWHGEAAFAYPGKARLSEIFILQHGPQNHFAPMAKARAAGELFARSFPPFHSAIGLERTIEFLNRVVDTVPCFGFQFVPDRTAVETVLQFKGAR